MRQRDAAMVQQEAIPERMWRRGIWILLLLALFFKGKLLYVILYALVLTYFVSRWLLNRGFQAIHCKRDVSVDHVFLGEEVAVSVELRNLSRIPIAWVMATDETSHEVSVTDQRRAVMSLGPQEKKRWTYRISGRRRGIHYVGPLRLEAGDPFGVGHVLGRVELRTPIVVYPRVHPMEELGLPSTLPFGDLQTTKRFFDDPAHAIGARKYEPGDPFKSVHWKITARTGELHVKEYQPTISVDTVLFLNLNESEYEVHLLEFYSELAIEVAASIAYQLVQQRQPVGFVTNGAGPENAGDKAAADTRQSSGIHIYPQKGGAGLMRILEVLATIRCAPATPFPQLLSETASRLSWGATLILVTPVDSPELMRTLLKLRKAGFHLIVIIVGLAPVHPEYLHRSLTSGITFYHVRSPSELREIAVS